MKCTKHSKADCAFCPIFGAEAWAQQRVSQNEKTGKQGISVRQLGTLLGSESSNNAVAILGRNFKGHL